MIPPELLEILCCPESRQGLQLAESDLIARLNREVESRTLRNRAGEPLREPLQGGLIRTDGKLLYPIRHGILVLLVNEAILLSRD